MATNTSDIEMQNLENYVRMLNKGFNLNRLIEYSNGIYNQESIAMHQQFPVFFLKTGLYNDPSMNINTMIIYMKINV